MGVFINLQQHLHLCTCFVPGAVLTSLYPNSCEVGIIIIPLHKQENRHRKTKQ